MRHRKAGRKFGRQSGPRRALFSGLVTNLVRYERIETTDAKAKELRRHAERAITWGRRVAELVERPPETLEDHERAKIIHAMRMVRRVVRDREVVHKLFHEIAPRYLGRPGGYTRIIKVRNRHGDAAPMSFIELLPAEAEQAPPEPKGGKAKKGKPEAPPPAKAAAGKAGKAGKAAKAEKKPEAPAKKPKKKKGED